MHRRFKAACIKCYGRGMHELSSNRRRNVHFMDEIFLLNRLWPIDSVAFKSTLKAFKSPSNRPWPSLNIVLKKCLPYLVQGVTFFTPRLFFHLNWISSKIHKIISIHNFFFSSSLKKYNWYNIFIFRWDSKQMYKFPWDQKCYTSHQVG